MKKLLVITLLLVYGFSSMGMTISLHYCCGKLKSIDWLPVKENSCGGQHKMFSKPCCETKQISNKEKFDQANFPFVVKSFKTISEAAKPGTETAVLKPINRQLSPIAFAPPPLLSQPPLFLLNRVFRI